MNGREFHWHAWLDGLGVIGYPVDEGQRAELHDAWLHAFCPGVRRATGDAIHRGYRWHAFSYGYDLALCGESATRAYARAGRSNFRLLFEDGSIFECFGPPAVDLSGEDCYVFSDDLGWTMAFTHEQESGLGPYFVRHG